MAESTATAPTAISDDARLALRDLILILADSKRLLGTRYAAWILGAPELETGIACASMAQDEWGHGRLLYALLKDFGDDVDRLEHDRAAHEYRNIEVLDTAPSSWAALVALNSLVDPALTVQLEALRSSAYAPVRQRVGKLLDEEHFHSAHGVAWLRRMARSGAAGRAAVTEAVQSVLPIVLRWFGRDADASDLRAAGIADASGDALRARYIARVGPVLSEIGIDAAELGAPDFTGFDEATRRVSSEGPDESTIAKVRGDKNRVFLMD
jgi:ring-1,2-phenylacetyl-CoA epoxidase subunit PaaC